MSAQCAVVVATCNRHENLLHLLNALLDQTLRPEIVIIADSSDEYYKNKVRVLCLDPAFNPLKLVFLDANFKSLTRQKNFAIKWLIENWRGQYVQILDDDTIPPKTYLQQLSAFLEGNKNFVGVSGITHELQSHSQSRSLKFRLAQLGGLESVKSGSVTKGGIGTFTALEHDDSSPVEWLHGCAMWRLSIFNHLTYLDRLEGSALCEDLEFSVRARRLGNLAVLNGSVLGHELSNLGRPDEFLHSYRFARNRAFVFQAVSKSNRLPIFYYLTNLLLFCRALSHLGRSAYRTSSWNTIRGLTMGTWAAVTGGRVL